MLTVSLNNYTTYPSLPPFTHPMVPRHAPRVKQGGREGEGSSPNMERPGEAQRGGGTQPVRGIQGRQTAVQVHVQNYTLQHLGIDGLLYRCRYSTTRSTCSVTTSTSLTPTSPTPPTFSTPTPPPPPLPHPTHLQHRTNDRHSGLSTTQVQRGLLNLFLQVVEHSV